MMRSPLFISIAMHYYYSPEPWPQEDMHLAQRMAHVELREAGLIEELPGPNDTTHWAGVPEPLQMYVEALGSVPLPVKKWVMPEQEEG